MLKKIKLNDYITNFSGLNLIENKIKKIAKKALILTNLKQFIIKHVLKIEIPEKLNCSKMLRCITSS